MGQRAVWSTAAALVVALVAAAEAAKPPAFFDFDCDLVATTGRSSIDWDAVYATVGPKVALGNSTSFEFPDSLRSLLEGSAVEQAEEECPLGLLYLQLLSFYEAFTDNSIPKKELQPQYLQIQALLGRFPVYAVALSRWPVFYALEYFAESHTPQPEHFCDEARDGVINWATLRADAERWTAMKRGRVEPDGIEDMERQLSDRYLEVLRSNAAQNQAQDECQFGFYFVIANQQVAAADRETQHLPPFNQVMDDVMASIPFVHVAASGWPIFAILAIFSDLNKGLWFFGGDRKYLRGYSDWNLRRDELSPLTPAALDFLSSPWMDAAAGNAELLARTPASDYASTVHALACRREEADGPMRPIVRGLVDTALGVAAAARGSNHRLVYVVLLYGDHWAQLLARLVRRLRQLGVCHALLVVAIGEAASASCQMLTTSDASRERSLGCGQTLCWTPDSQSQVHRFTAIHAMLHLGVDVLYLDMDTFLLQDPTSRVLELAADADALFARHADADCINIGVFYIRATGQTAVWLSQFLAWYHDHPFEIDQRGLHVFLRLPAETLRVAYPPKDLVHIRAGILDDVNEVVIGDVGWHGTLSNLLIFHWCHRPLAQKEEELGAAYDAGDAAASHNMPLVLAVSTAASQRQHPSGNNWEAVTRLRGILETYQRSSPPEREPCW